MKVVHKLKLKTCPNCKKLFNDQKFGSHSAFCQLYNIQCPHCSQFIDRRQLQQHIQQNHTGGECPDCKLHLKNQAQIKEHKSQCRRKPKQCHYCKMTVRFEEYQEHILDCGSRTKECMECGGFVMLREWDMHARRCGGGEQGNRGDWEREREREREGERERERERQKGERVGGFMKREVELPHRWEVELPQRGAGNAVDVFSSAIYEPKRKQVPKRSQIFSQDFTQSLYQDSKPEVQRKLLEEYERKKIRQPELPKKVQNEQTGFMKKPGLPEPEPINNFLDSMYRPPTPPRPKRSPRHFSPSSQYNDSQYSIPGDSPPARYSKPSPPGRAPPPPPPPPPAIFSPPIQPEPPRQNPFDRRPRSPPKPTFAPQPRSPPKPTFVSRPPPMSASVPPRRPVENLVDLTEIDGDPLSCIDIEVQRDILAQLETHNRSAARPYW